MGLCNSTIEGNKRHEPGTITSAAAGQWKKSRDLNGGGGGGGDNDGVNGVVGRMVSSGCSEVACLYSQQGRKGINQDAMLVWEDFSSQTDTVLCGVFDGHGPFGHMVAKKVRDNLPLILSTQWKAAADSETTCTDENQGNESASIDDQWGESTLREDDEQLPEICMPLKRSMLKTCQQLDKELKFHPTIDCFCSGTTAVTLIKQGHDIVVGNIGDSRAVLATKYEDDSLMAVQLTVDLKPDLPREAARIQKCKGRVFALQDEPEVARVWLPNNDSPGLAMARAFGDFCLKDFGLISVPDIYYHRVTANDQFVILASDGVWDVLSNKEAVDIVASAPSRATSARALVDTAVRAWRLKYPTSKNDDCTAVCLFLEHSSSALEFPDAKLETHEEDVQETIAISNNNSSLDEIVPVCEVKEANAIKSCPVESKRTLAECLSVVEDDEWTALEGLTRVNSLLSIPRFLSGELRRSASWRKWL